MNQTKYQDMIIDLGKYDLRLLELSGELFALEDHLQLIESQMEHIRKTERLRIEAELRKDRLSPEDPEWHQALDGYTELIECLLPRFFRGTFLMTLYAVYESGVKEIAKLMQEKNPEKISINEFIQKTRGNFLQCAKKYYEDILNFDLYTKEDVLENVKMLYELRNAYAHANGRLESIKRGPRKTIYNWIKQNKDVRTYRGYIVCGDRVVSDVFINVRDFLEDLINRYNKWDDGKNH